MRLDNKIEIIIALGELMVKLDQVQVDFQSEMRRASDDFMQRYNKLTYEIEDAIKLTVKA